MAVINGTSGPDHLTGTNDDDQIFGFEGWDVIVGSEGNDAIEGGGGPGDIDFVSYQNSSSAIDVNLVDGIAYDDGLGGADTLVGIEGVDDSPHDDTIIGSAEDNWINLFHGGADQVDAGDGFDLLLYDNAPGPVTINLDTGVSQDGQGNTDTTLNFEAAHGSAFGDFITLTNGDGYTFGRAGDDTILGLDGNDNLIGGSGNDILDGGDGAFDNVDYFDDGFEFNGPPPATHGANVNLETGIAIDGWGDIDTISNVEHVSGSQFDDTIMGNTGTEFGNGLFGHDGDDVIHNGGTAGLEFDHLDGGNGNDSLTLEGAGNAFGGHGDDTIEGVAGGNSQFFGGDGADILRNGGTIGTEFDHLGGGDGNDTFTAKGGVNVVGDAGDDTVRAEYHGDDRDFVILNYRFDPGAIVANLTSSANGSLAGGSHEDGFLVADGYGDIDNVAGFHALQGSAFDDLVFVDSTFQTSYGNWIEVRPGDGDDTITFEGVATARISYFPSHQGPVYADMEAGFATDLHSTGTSIGYDIFTGATQFRGSQHGDVIFGALGDDQRLRGQNGDDEIDGRSGNDVVDGENGHDTLRGGLGDDEVLGGNGDDIIIDNGTMGEISEPTGPGKGLGHLKERGNGHEKREGGDVPGHDKHHADNTLIEDDDVYAGGAGDDLFVFPANNGHDVIRDFSAGESSPDVIDLSSWGLADFDALLALADDQGGAADVVLTLDQDNSITLDLVRIGDLHTDDFILA